VIVVTAPLQPRREDFLNTHIFFYKLVQNTEFSSVYRKVPRVPRYANPGPGNQDLRTGYKINHMYTILLWLSATLNTMQWSWLHCLIVGMQNLWLRRIIYAWQISAL